MDDGLKAITESYLIKCKQLEIALKTLKKYEFVTHDPHGRSETKYSLAAEALIEIAAMDEKMLIISVKPGFSQSITLLETTPVKIVSENAGTHEFMLTPGYWELIESPSEKGWKIDVVRKN